MICRAKTILLAVLLVVSRATADHTAPVLTGDQVAPVSPADRSFVEDLEHRSFVYFWEQASLGTGLVLDRARVDGGRAKGPSRDIASTAATGFGLTAICIGAEDGWFYDWMDVSTGERKWDSETSSIDTAFLLGGVLTAGGIFLR